MQARVRARREDSATELRQFLSERRIAVAISVTSSNIGKILGRRTAGVSELARDHLPERTGPFPKWETDEGWSPAALR